ncbi:MAG: hypothetical protein QM667_01205 [Asticcacaulis sp.]
MTIPVWVAVLGLAAAPQDTSIVIEQVGEAKAVSPEAARAPQIVKPATGDAAAPPQIAPPSVRREVQGAPKTAHGDTPQLTRGKQTADAPESGSTRAQGRNVATEAVSGNDRCDAESPDKDKGCDDVIETRSAEFTAPDVQPLSPEQKLLASQKALEDSARDVNSATRRLANGEVDASNIGLAASAIGALKPEDKAEQKTDPAAAQQSAIISTVINIVQPQQ